MTAPSLILPDDADDTDAPETPETPEGGSEIAVEPLLKEDGSPYTRADIDGLREALKKARREARRKPADTPGDTEAPDLDAVRAEVDTRWKARLVKSEARTAFVSAGLVVPEGDNGATLSKVLRLIDVDDLDVTDDGVEGLEDAVADVKRDFPTLFAAPGKPRPGRVDAADRGNPPPTPKTSAEALMAGLLGSR